ncbi:SDR family NAD(P)-dependent oxidoreductase [Marivivens sp. JLT3646]|uniref:SDR family NAD(P)-dependent oxidoreductase n=1 Tax=Marivivens sp. JLT3646 TaxID=1920883 RepID=UPI0009388259|nr:SDR family NAD(P)-dependent oxidoreductase [Marivivens sp. JLT3646]APO85973.1 C factor, cell signaling protein [Marivivens sp. JLT3646]
MKRNLIIGASGGIGRAFCDVVDGEVIGLSRRDNGLDVTDPASVDRVFGAIEGPFDRVIIAVGILAPDGAAPEKSLSAIDAQTMAQVFAVNTIGVALILQQMPRLLAPSGRVGVLSARVGSIGDNGLGGWHSYRASKAAVNQIIRGTALELKRTHKGSVVLALHPGTVDTPFTAGYAAKKLTPTDSATALLSVLDGAGADQSGSFYDFNGATVPW